MLVAAVVDRAHALGYRHVLLVDTQDARIAEAALLLAVDEEVVARVLGARCDAALRHDAIAPGSRTSQAAVGRSTPAGVIIDRYHAAESNGAAHRDLGNA